MSKQVTITLEQLKNWGAKSPGIKFNKTHTVETYIKLMEDFPPAELFDHVRPTVLEEGTDVKSITVKLLDESTGTEYDYNPGLDLVFS